MAGKPPVKKIAIGAGVGISLAVVAAFAVKTMGAVAPVSVSPGPAQRVAKAWDDLNAHLQQFQTVDEDNTQLRNENGRMRLSIARLQMDCSSQITQAQTRKLSEKLDQETGQAVGRLLETIEYRPPNHLLPNQLLVLAGSYFKAKDYERTAVIMTDLVGRDITKDFRTPANFLMTAVAWYNLDHFKQADHFLGKVLESESTEEIQKVQAQARLWRALLSKRLGVEQDSQYWLNELVSNHPQSPEAGWVNGSAEGARTIATEPATEPVPETVTEEHGTHQ